ncbi:MULTISPECIES: Lrp/AsnC family transcriptional regulator [Mycolicibacterium]|uniref:Regulatory protein AsnC n=1 Tax=Mycolicibacterium mageritense TaxID=53462 RepID=A0AAI8TUN0_MYCME|nr:Lrp/AsnC family transcriptional regulator [Mycolicibacterium mageritense]MBN3454756.1 Lrp/AsnC family transcriptional regulator [Mycobacterium sp. DSM 3803]OKH72285.1 AsnC family transcriptional regulator [Mycobacterium sp. SWH-M3]TXI63840.1 MAG: Lrp/AsnC family transcriptional regulator [Mycolicibacterium mageritense]BDY28716.1 Regulatory protein AsnC [Mycolicibacterium mageritense]GJJ20383.1 AsnC family transcriptional regulator [Mycolicibacterium mageritense]
MVHLDRLDADLIGLLERNGRMGVAELASSLGVARNTIQSRLRRLEESGLLRGFRPDIDLDAAGVAVQAFIALEVEQGRLLKIAELLTAMPEILEIHVTTGREDLLARVATESQAGLQQLIEHIVSIPGVVHSATTLTLTTPLRYRIEPLLDKLTRSRGWGRSTPAPKD